MKETRLREDPLRTILKQEGMEVPSDSFSDQLTSLIVDTYQQEQISIVSTKKPAMAHWPGKIIAAMLAGIVLWSFSMLDTVQIKAVVISSLLALILGIGILIQMTKKMLLSKI
ncbi:hypothetical protein [Xanthocytophaga flava]|uniref:hypothetical protein n=1 Tax=Xanthocytophaga flava TaxID=3048013 RepID=UPI0028D8CF6D|nr:hypothetical protein [Xanthocytophaga flavus]MDJ1466822.1 hypothetical protein [Xanthocytophaga flavus]